MAPPRKPRPSRYAVALDVPRSDGWRAWTAAAGEFGERLAAQATWPVLAAGIDTETRRGADYVRIRVTQTVEAANVVEAVALAWEAFRTAAGDPGAWDLPAATAVVRPANGLRTRTRRPGPQSATEVSWKRRGSVRGCPSVRMRGRSPRS